MPKKATKKGKGRKGNALNRDEPEQSLPTMPNLAAYISRHPQVIRIPCSTLRAAEKVLEENKSPISLNEAIPVDGTLPGANDLSISEQNDSTFRPQTLISEDAASANLDNMIDNIVTSVLPQPQNAAVNHWRYPLRHAKPVLQKNAKLRIAKRVQKNEAFIDSAAESEDGSTPMTKKVAIAESSPQGHRLEESNPDPPSEHLKSTTDNVVPTVCTPAACNSSNQSDMHLTRSVSFTLSEMVNLMDDGSSSQSEVGFRGHPLVTIEGYRVKEEVAPTLRRILSKHGDIAANCSYRHPKLRSALLENFCEIIHELEALEFTKVTIDKIKSIRDLVDDLKDDLDVIWLLKRLDDIMDSRQLVSSLIEGKKKLKQDTEGIEEENEALKEKLKVNHEKLTALKAETITIKTKFSEAKEKVKCFYRRPLVEDLL